MEASGGESEPKPASRVGTNSIQLVILDGSVKSKEERGRGKISKGLLCHLKKSGFYFTWTREPWKGFMQWNNIDRCTWEGRFVVWSKTYFKNIQHRVPGWLSQLSVRLRLRS